MRMVSPKTGMKSGETWDMDGCALAKSTSSATSMGPGILHFSARGARARADDSQKKSAA